MRRGDDEGTRADAVASVAEDLLILDARDLRPLDCAVSWSAPQEAGRIFVS